MALKVPILSWKVTWLAAHFEILSCSRLATISLKTEGRRFNLVLKAVVHVMVRRVVIVPSVWVGWGSRPSGHHSVLVTIIEHRSWLMMVGRWKLILEASWTSLVNTWRAKLVQSSIVWIIQSMIMRQVNAPTWCIETALTFGFKLVLPFSLKVSANPGRGTKMFNLVCMHKVLMHFAGWTSSESRFEQICYTFFLFHYPVFQSRVV